ncbi:MAG: HlyC/CorC family transporter [Thermoleophilaceae bacterium]|nr:HlyC/CorC family transporter [Thermoleophilaceae bacterium]MDQ3355603.1 hemolysin family protein [Actinomycetota bacterium]
MTTVLFALALIALVAINGLFVAAEFALVRARKDRMESLVEEGRRGARLALRQIERIDEYLSACQVGITLASIGIGFLGERAIGDQLEGALEGVVGAVAGGILGFLLAYFITTFAHITIGEQVPKIYAITHAEATARLIAGTLELFRVAAKPFIWLVNVSSNAMLRVVGVNAQAEFEEPANQEEVKMLIARGMQGGTLDPGEATMLSGVFHLHEQQARQVMTPIPAVVTVDVSEDVRTALERCVESGHTRLVVTEDENTDRIRGVVHSNSLVRRLMREGPETSVEGSVKEALIVPETRALDDLLADLQRERMSVAVVVDEYGRTVGIVSVEDIVEEVVGEIADETDPAAAGVRRLANNDWYVRGHIPITDLDDYGMHLEVDSDAYNSVGGFIFSELGRLPKRGDMVRANDYSLRVESVRQNRVEAVRIRDHEPARRARQHAANGRTQLEAGGEPSAGGDGPGEGSPASAPSAKAE